MIVGAVPSLPESSKRNIVGIVMFGSTRTDEEEGLVPNYPAANTLNICAEDDGICDGGVDVTPGHLEYLDDVPTAVTFLRGRISAAGGV